MSTYIPPYVPPHLRGNVDTFQQEPDGRVSFRHDAAGNGEFGEAGGRQTISREQYDQTFNPQYRLANLATAMPGQYGLQKFPTNASQQIRDWIGGKLGQGLDWGTSTQGRSIGTAGLLSALAGGIGGARAGDESPIKSGLMYALLAGGAGAGVSALLQNLNAKREQQALNKAAKRDESLDYLREAVLDDPRLTSTQRAQVLRALAGMPDGDRDDLAHKANALVGAAAGMFIARVLASKGLIPPLVGGIIGALVASPSGGGKVNTNQWGQLSY